MEHLCGELPWGPWQGSVFTRCSQDVLIGGMLSCFILIGGGKRLYQLTKRRKYSHNINNITTSNKNIAKLVMCAAVLLLEIVNVIGEYATKRDGAGAFRLVYALHSTAAWGLCCALVFFELARGLAHGWELTTWWLLQTVFWSFRMQQLADHTPGIQTINLITWIPSLVLVVGISILGVWMNKPTNATYKKLHNAVSMDVLKGKGDSSYELESDIDDEAEEGTGPIVTWNSHSPTPEDSASFMSKVTFWWINRFMSKGYTTPITDDLIWAVAEQDRVQDIIVKFEKNWNHQLLQPKPSLIKAIIATFWKSALFSGTIKFCSDMATLSNPIFLNRLIDFVETPSTPMSYGILFAFGIFTCQLCRSVFANQHFYLVTRGGIQCRSAMNSIVYRKALKLSSAARQKSTTGEIVNHQAIDASKFVSVAPHFHMFWSGPLQICLALYMLFSLLGVSGIGGLLGMGLLIPVNTVISRVNAKYQIILLKYRDQRMRLLNEVLNGMRVIKFFSWERSFIDKIRDIRNLELGALLWAVAMRSFTSIVMYTSPVVVAVATFTTYTLLDNELTPQVAFTSLAVFMVLRQPLTQFPSSISGFIEANVSIKRLQKFLLNDELDPNAVQNIKADDNTAIKIVNGNFAWVTDDTTGDNNSTNNSDTSSVSSGDDEDAALFSKGEYGFSGEEKVPEGINLTLRNINIEIPRKKLIAVVGSVGSGKTSLVSALIGEIPKITGSVSVHGEVAFVSQQPWIKNNTLRDNIIFGCPFDEKRYAEVLRVCELEHDLSILPNGDSTEIGERGINLSGGQKARVSLARAIYQDADIYILDSPLAAVDAHVGRNIFTNCIMGSLKNKTRVLVTHQADLLPSVDLILFMRHGRIAAQGTYSELVQNNPAFADLIAEFVHNNEAPEGEATPSDKKSEKKSDKPQEKKKDAGGEKSSSSAPTSPSTNGDDKNKLIQKEHQQLGSVSFGIYKHYFTAVGGLHMIFITLACFAADTGCRAFADWWLSRWSTQEEENASSTKNSMYYYLGIYLAGTIGSIVFGIIKTILVTHGGLKSARKLHDDMLVRVFAAPISFFDTTPIGRLLNRFSKDQNGIDEGLTQAILMFANQSFLAIAVIVIVSIASPIFRATLFPLLYIFYYTQQYYLRSSRELQRLDSISKSPIFAQLSETLSGLSTIRALNASQRFISENDNKINKNSRIQIVIQAANRWLAMRMELLCTVTVAMASFFAVLARNSTDPGTAGLSVSYALQFTFILNMLVRQGSDVETQLVSVERVVEYTGIDVEGPYESAVDSIPPTWPEHGQISMHNLQLRYRPGLDLVLKGITCEIKPKEKIGICGRTGAGKSSFVAALFRLVEFAGGKIVIDGIDISTIGLHDLRSRISIIPQDPTLFMGTIRSNLDPFEEADDYRVWDVLERVNLKDFVSSLPDGLLTKVTENGDNFSVGQRQLFCLGRSLIKNARILVMDEATAAVDIETDQFIQKTIRTGFKECTVLTIAHRLNTIMDYDRIMVMDSGHVREFDTPEKLMSNPNGVFYSLVQSSMHAM